MKKLFICSWPALYSLCSKFFREVFRTCNRHFPLRAVSQVRQTGAVETKPFVCNGSQ